MTIPDDPHLLNSIIRRLAVTADRHQVVEELCSFRNLPWSEAEALVEHALQNHQSVLVRLQSPILVPLALALFIGGVALAAWQLLGLAAVLSALANPSAATFWDIYNLSFGFFDLLANFWGMLAAFVTGLAMVFGSYLGMKGVWAAWLEALEIGKRLEKEEWGGELFPRQPTPALTPEFNAGLLEDVELVESIINRFEKTGDLNWVIAGLMLSRGLDWQTADGLVYEVLRAKGRLSFRQRVFPPQAFFSMLGVSITGLVISLQYLAVSGAILRPAWERVTDQYRFVQFLYRAGQYVGSTPGPFFVFILGLSMLIGGLFSLRLMLPSLYRWGRQSR